MTRVLICDDALAFATLVRYWLSECPDLRVVGACSSGRRSLELATSIQPDVILLDHILYDVPGGSAELAPQLRERCPGASIVLMSGMPESDLAGIAVACGADAFLSKACRPEQMQAAVREAAGARAETQPA